MDVALPLPRFKKLARNQDRIGSGFLEVMKNRIGFCWILSGFCRVGNRVFIGFFVGFSSGFQQAKIKKIKSKEGQNLTLSGFFWSTTIFEYHL